MVTSNDCIKKYGYPDLVMERTHLQLWVIPKHIAEAIPELPRRIYCNSDLIEPLTKAFEKLIERDLACYIMTWDGCFNIRKKRGGNSLSLHSWAIAIDVNAAWNGFNQNPQLDLRVVQCFVDSGFDWGGEWNKPDGMHFQLSEI